MPLAPDPAAPRRLRVDFAAPTGPILHGAAGSLYGVSEDGVPGDELLDALDITTLAVKPDGGAQHPNGDASPAVAALRRNGSGLAFVYLQDLFAAWPYEDVGIDVYHERLFEVVPPMLTEANAGRLVFVPFNEPDWIWYALGEGDPANFDRFLADWITTVQLLRALAPGVPIAGPNEARYHPEFLPHFLRRARDTGTLPEWMAWHELSPESLAAHRAHHRAYRELERSLGIAPLPVNIDEYGGNRDLSVPGRLVQWAAAFEETGVHADMAYWTAAGSYSGAAPQPNVPNGAWWFLRAYSGMTGTLVRVEPPAPETADSLQGLATLDTEHRDARILVGGADEDFVIEATGLDPAVWGGRVTATVHRIDWSGYEGAAGPPVPIAQVTGAPERLTIPVGAPDPMAAYWVAVTPGEPGDAGAVAPIPVPPWKGAWEAESAQITSGTVHRQGRTADGNGFAASGDYDVTDLGTNDSAVEFAVAVPEEGEYDLGIFYAHMYGRGHEPIEPQPAEQVLAVNGAERFVRYATTMNWQHRSVAVEPVRLRKGANTIRLSKSGAIGTASGEATLDKIELTERGPERTVYEGALARRVEGDRVFDLYAGADGYHRIEAEAAAPEAAAAGIAAEGTAATDRPERLAVLVGPQNQNVPVNLERPVFLHRGVNRLRTGSEVERLVVTPTEGPAPVEVLAHEANRAGGSCLVVNDFAVGGHVIGWNGRGAAATITVQSRGGPHALLVHYANGERGKAHEYNIDVVTLHCDLTVNGAKTGRHPMRSTWTWNDFWSYPLIVDLVEGPNTLTFDNPDAPTADLERFRIAPLNP